VERRRTNWLVLEKHYTHIFLSYLSIAVPHRLTEDDEYRGYRLPKNSIIIPNGWWANSTTL